MSKTDLEFGHASKDQFFWWINERHRIWCKRNDGMDPPWTTDPTMQTYKFTNVFRELDRGTLVLRHLLKDEHDPKVVIFTCFWYRLFGREDLLRRVGICRDWPSLSTGIHKQVKEGRRLYTGAYMTTGVRGEEKYLTTLRATKQIEAELPLLLKSASNGSLERLFYKILEQNYYGISNFLAYEVVSDLRHYSTVMPEVTDADSWANIGPGCKRGLERLGMRVNVKALQRLYDVRMEYLEPHILSAPVPFEMREIEHSLCEFDKYQRTVTGAGRPKQRFHLEKKKWYNPL